MKLIAKIIAAHTYAPSTALPNPHRFDGIVEAAERWARAHPNPYSFRRKKPHSIHTNEKPDN